MNRRAFLAWLTGTAAGVAAAPYLDLDRILWTPGERTIFLPSDRQRLLFGQANLHLSPELYQALAQYAKQMAEDCLRAQAEIFDRYFKAQRWPASR